MNASDEEIDAGAEALRQRLQGGKKLNAWQDLPNSTKRKWRDYSAVVLCAALSVTLRAAIKDAKDLK